MPRALVSLVFLLHLTAGEITTKLVPHYSDVLKGTCDQLPYRTVFYDSKCYFVIDAEVDSVRTSAQCSLVLSGAKLTGNAPADVYSMVFIEKGDFLGEGESTGKKMKAMCVYGVERRFPCLDDLPASDSGTCIRTKNIDSQTRINYQLGPPYFARFKDKLEVGQTITVKGVLNPVRADWDKLAIALRGDGNNVPFHINFHYHLGQTVFDFATNGNWDSYTNPNHQRLGMPLKRGVPFDIRIVAKEDRFQVFVDGKPFGEHKYYHPLSSVTRLYILNWQSYGHLSHVQLGEKYEPFPPPKAMLSLPICRKKVSQCGTVKQGSTCKSIVVSGLPTEGAIPQFFVTLTADDFTISLQYNNSDIALNFFARLGHNLVALNSKRNGVWGTQLVENKMPFKRNVRFEVSITREACAYQIAVNGKHFTTFVNRLPPGDIANVVVQGIDDVDVKIV